MRSSGSCLKSQYLLFSLRSNSSCLCFLLGLPLLSPCSSVTCFRKLFRASYYYPIYPSFILFYDVCSLPDSAQYFNGIRSVLLTFFGLLKHNTSEPSRNFSSAFCSTQVSASYKSVLHLLQFYWFLL
jgi:hypothetical protein